MADAPAAAPGPSTHVPPTVPAPVPMNPAIFQINCQFWVTQLYREPQQHLWSRCCPCQAPLVAFQAVALAPSTVPTRTMPSQYTPVLEEFTEGLVAGTNGTPGAAQKPTTNRKPPPSAFDGTIDGEAVARPPLEKDDDKERWKPILDNPILSPRPPKSPPPPPTPPPPPPLLTERSWKASAYTLEELHQLKEHFASVVRKLSFVDVDSATLGALFPPKQPTGGTLGPTPSYRLTASQVRLWRKLGPSQQASLVAAEEERKGAATRAKQVLSKRPGKRKRALREQEEEKAKKQAAAVAAEAAAAAERTNEEMEANLSAEAVKEQPEEGACEGLTLEQLVTDRLSKERKTLVAKGFCHLVAEAGHAMFTAISNNEYWLLSPDFQGILGEGKRNSDKIRFVLRLCPSKEPFDPDAPNRSQDRRCSFGAPTCSLQRTEKIRSTANGKIMYTRTLCNNCKDAAAYLTRRCANLAELRGLPPCRGNRHLSTVHSPTEWRSLYDSVNTEMRRNRAKMQHFRNTAETAKNELEVKESLPPPIMPVMPPAAFVLSQPRPKKKKTKPKNPPPGVTNGMSATLQGQAAISENDGFRDCCI